MTQHLTERDVRSIAEYARIGLDADEVVQMTVDLNAIIDSLKPITEYDLDGVELRSTPSAAFQTSCARTKNPPPSRRERRWRTRRSSRTAAF